MTWNIEDKMMIKPLTNLASLKAEPTVTRVDNVLVQTDIGLFGLKKTSSEIANDVDVVQPSDDPAAKWILVSNVNPSKTFTISISGGNYTTIQAALDANTAGGELFIVYPGTYTDDTISFTANNQTVLGASERPEDVLITSANTNIVDFTAFTGCVISRLKVDITNASSVVNTVQGEGEITIYRCHVDMTASYSTGGVQPACFGGGGVFNIESGKMNYNHSGSIGTGIPDVKRAIFLGDGAEYYINNQKFTVEGSNTSFGSTLALGSGTSIFKVDRSKISVLETGSAATSIVLTGAGVVEFSYNEILTTSAVNQNAIGIWLIGSAAVKCKFNSITCISGGGTGKAYSYQQSNGSIVSTMEDIVAADGKSLTGGTFAVASSEDAGNFGVSGKYKVSGDNLSANSSPQEVTVGDNHCDYATYSAALTTITDASESKPYTLEGETQYNTEPTIITKSYTFTDGSKTHFNGEIQTSDDSDGNIGRSTIASAFNLYAFHSASNISVWNAGRLKSTAASNVGMFSGTVSLNCNFVHHNQGSSAAQSACYGYVGLDGGDLNAITNLALVESASGFTSHGLITSGNAQSHIINNLRDTGTGDSVGWFASDDSHESQVTINSLTSDKALDWDGGVNSILANHVESRNASTINGSATNYIVANHWDGDITIGAGATVYGNINRFDGVIGGAGSFIGMAGDTFYGSYTFMDTAIFEGAVQTKGSIHIEGDQKTFKLNDTYAENKQYVIEIFQSGLPATSYATAPAARIKAWNYETTPTEQQPGFLFGGLNDEMILGLSYNGNIHQNKNTFNAFNAYDNSGFKVGVNGYSHVTKHDNATNRMLYYMTDPYSEVADDSLSLYKEIGFEGYTVYEDFTGYAGGYTFNGEATYNTEIDTGIVEFFGTMIAADEDESKSIAMAGVKGNSFSTMVGESPINFTAVGGKDTSNSINIYYDGTPATIHIKNTLTSTNDTDVYLACHQFRFGIV